MIRVLFTFLLSIQYDSLLVVSMIHSNARQVVLLDVSSSVFMVDLKVNPNYINFVVVYGSDFTLLS